MGPAPRWFDRKFEFTFPLAQQPNLCARLRGTPARLEDSLLGHSRDLLIRKPTGKWSAQEQAGHLLDLEPLWLQRVHDFLAGNGQLTPADLRNQKTDQANHNARSLEEILADFRRARLQIVDQVETLAPEFLGRTLLHPRLQQPMRLLDHLYFVAEHDDHHLAEIWDLIHPRSA